MPIYEFECRACGERFERLQKLSDSDPTDCPVCAKAEVQRRLTAPSFRLAGSGWYETDFKKDGDKKRNLAEKGEAPAASTSDSSAPAPAPAVAAAPKTDSAAPAPAQGGSAKPPAGAATN